MTLGVEHSEFQITLHSLKHLLPRYGDGKALTVSQSLGIQLVCLTVSPAFIAGGIYLTLKHIIIIYGSRFSRIRPRLYTWIFVSCDVLSILIQT